MLLSKACRLAVRASVFLAAQTPSAFVSVRVVAREVGAPFHFLSKTLQRLTAAGVIDSLQGPRGGVRLTPEGRQDTVLDIVLAIDGNEVFESCVLGLEECGHERPCPLHERWAEARASIEKVFESSRLEQVGSTYQETHTRLKDLLNGKDVI